MSDSKNALQATVEDYFSDDSAAPRPRKPTKTSTRRRSQSRPPSSLRKTTAPDTESVDSGYSSKTAATQNSLESTYNSRRAHPITFNAAPAASLSRQRSSSVGPQILSKSDQKSPHTTEASPSSHPYNQSTPVAAMGDSFPCQYPNCERCIAQRAQRRYSLERQLDGNYAAPYHPQYANPYQPQPPPTLSFPPSSFGHPVAPAPRRAYAGGLPRPRPLSYHGQRLSPASTGPPAYPPPNAADPFYRAATVAPGSTYLPPPQAYTQPLPTSSSPRRPARPQITHYETERSASVRPSSVYGSTMVTHLYRSAPVGQFHPTSPHDRRRRSTSPMISGPSYDDDRDVMPPPPVPRSAYAEISRDHSRSDSARRHHESERRHSYIEDGQADHDWDPNETIKPTRAVQPRPSILPDPRGEHSYSSSAIPSRYEIERSGSRRKSYAGPEDVADRTHKAESYIARTSQNARDPLTAEAVKRVNRRSVDSSSRSRKSQTHSQGRKSSEHDDGGSSYVSKGGTKLQIRAGEDDSWELEGDMAGHSIRLIPQEGGGRPQMIIDGGSGRETRYYKEGSKTSKTSNKSFASRVGRAGRSSDSGKDDRTSSQSGRHGHRSSKPQNSRGEADSHQSTRE